MSLGKPIRIDMKLMDSLVMQRQERFGAGPVIYTDRYAILVTYKGAIVVDRFEREALEFEVEGELKDQPRINLFIKREEAKAYVNKQSVNGGVYLA